MRYIFDKVQNFRKIYSQAKPLYLFIIQGLLLLLVWLIFYKILRNNQSVEEFYKWGTKWLIDILLWFSALFLDMFGFSTFTFMHNGKEVIQINDALQGVRLDLGCLGRNIMGAFVGFIIAFPGQLKSKLWFIPLGLVAVNVLNVLRISLLCLILYKSPEADIEYHHDVFNYIVYIAIFGMWFFWIKKYGK